MKYQQKVTLQEEKVPNLHEELITNNSVSLNIIFQTLSVRTK